MFHSIPYRWCDDSRLDNDSATITIAYLAVQGHDALVIEMLRDFSTHARTVSQPSCYGSSGGEA